MRREIKYLIQMLDIQDLEDSYRHFKDQIKIKIDEMKEIEYKFENLGLSGKLKPIDPLMMII